MRPAPCVFMLAYSAAYAFSFAMDWPLFRYYPLRGDFNWGAGVLKGVGPAITWYGLMADSLLFGFVMSMLIPDRVLGHFVMSKAWIVPLCTLAFAIYLLRPLLF